LKALKKIILLVFAVTASVVAQNAVRGSLPAAAGSGPAFDVGLGGTYLAMSSPTGGFSNLYGADATGTVDFSRRWGGTVDAGYERASDTLSLGQSSYVLTFMGGPVFYPMERGNTRVSLRALIGAGLVDSAVPQSANSNLHGWVARPAYAAGIGVQQAVSSRFAVRVDADYLRTAFVDSTDTVQPQNNLRLTVSLVFHLRDRRF